MDDTHPITTDVSCTIVIIMILRLVASPVRFSILHPHQGIEASPYKQFNGTDYIHLSRTAEDLVTTSDTRSNLVILCLGVARRVKFGLLLALAHTLHGRRDFTHEGGEERTTEPYCISLAFVRNDIDLNAG
jgi:hypothetical protein